MGGYKRGWSISIDQTLVRKFNFFLRKAGLKGAEETGANSYCEDVATINIISGVGGEGHGGGAMPRGAGTRQGRYVSVPPPVSYQNPAHGSREQKYSNESEKELWVKAHFHD